MLRKTDPHRLLQNIENKSHELNQLIGRALSQNAGMLQIQIFKKSEEIDQLTVRLLSSQWKERS